MFRAPSSLDASVDFLPRANCHREARVSQPRLGKSLTAIEAIRQGASRSSIQVMYSKQGIALIAALPMFTSVLPVGHCNCQKAF